MVTLKKSIYMVLTWTSSRFLIQKCKMFSSSMLYFILLKWHEFPRTFHFCFPWTLMSNFVVFRSLFLLKSSSLLLFTRLSRDQNKKQILVVTIPRTQPNGTCYSLKYTWQSVEVEACCLNFLHQKIKNLARFVWSSSW